MHNNYHFLRHLVNTLQQKISGAVISECFSQNREELIIRFETASGPFIMKASLGAQFTCLSFPAQFNRARRNSVDLFPEIIGRRVDTVRQFSYERSFSLVLRDGIQLLFKMHGNKSNVLLFENDVILGLFRNNMIADRNINPRALDRSIDTGLATFMANVANPRALYFTLGPVAWHYLNDRGFESLTPEEKWKSIQDLLGKFEEGKFFLANYRDNVVLTLMETGEVIDRFDNPVHALNAFFHAYVTRTAIDQERSRVAAHFESVIRKSQSYVAKVREKLEELRNQDNYKTWADLLMANLHDIAPGTEKISLPDFYHEGKFVDIRLRKELNAQKNAAVYYRKAKNQEIEISTLERSLREKEQVIANAQASLIAARESTTVENLRSLLQQTAKVDDRTSQPFHAFDHMGFRILVGKSAESNDLLTFRHSYKEDLWLHAKDVAGSHVLIKHQAGKNFPKDVIERAAQLAAWNSKRKNETLCPVIVTPKKFVRKRKGDPAGAVVVEREEVILVEPKL